MICPKCRSNRTKTCAAAYEQGSRWGHYQTLSELALRCAPPEKKSPIGVLGGMALFLYIVAAGLFFLAHLVKSSGNNANENFYASLTDALAINLLTGLALLVALLILIAIPRMIYNRTLFNPKIESWRSAWVCLRCSTIYDGPKLGDKTPR